MDNVQENHKEDGPRVIVFGATHGHECLGAHILDALKEVPIVHGSVEYIIGNPRAYRKGYHL